VGAVAGVWMIVGAGAAAGARAGVCSIAAAYA
jgi:hypothetical protein